MNELKLLDNIIPLLPQNNNTLVGPGDDCAVVKFDRELVLLAADQVVSSVHYSTDTPASKVAEKLIKRNLSDIAAMGGVPSCALLTLAGNIVDDNWYMEFFTAISTSAKSYDVAISGGDVATLSSDSPPDSMVATLTIIGKIKEEKLCLRKNAEPGQLVLATGNFGNSFASNHHLDFTPRLAEGNFMAGNFTNCMIDVSDGLVLDLQRIAKASGVGIELNTSSIPLRENATLNQALSDGEDYELLITIDPERADALIRQWFFDTPITCIGKVISDNPGLVFDENGANLSGNAKTGYKHSSG